MMHTFSIILGISPIAIGFGLFFALPMAAAVLNGIQLARDPTHEGSDVWAAFSRAVFKKLRWWWLVWGVFLLMCYGFYYFESLVYLHQGFPRVPPLDALYMPIIILSWWLLMFGVCLLLAPRVHRKGWLAISMLLSSSLIFPLLARAMHSALPGQWAVINFETPNGIYQLNIYPLCNLVVCLLAVTFSWRWARRCGDQWFQS